MHNNTNHELVNRAYEHMNIFAIFHWFILKLLSYCKFGNSEIFARTLFSGIALKDIFTTLKIRAWLTYISKRQIDFDISRGFYIHETYAKFCENKTLAKISEFTVICFKGLNYEGGSICNENPFITPSAKALGFYAKRNIKASPLKWCL